MTKIRLAVPSDERNLLGMLQQLLAAHPDLYQASWAGSADARATVRYRIEKHQVVVAERMGVIVGAASWRTRVAPPPHLTVRYAELETLFVVPKLRGEGIARQLCERIQSLCRDQAITQVRVDRPVDEQSASVLVSAGFVPIEQAFVWPRKSIPKAESSAVSR